MSRVHNDHDCSCDGSCGRIVAFPRVAGETIRAFEFDTGQGIVLGEVVEVRAAGVFGGHKYPVSLHITVPVRCPAIPLFFGDRIKLTIERE